jgi:hypothetical protein
MKAYRSIIVRTLLILSTRRSWVVTIKTQPLYPGNRVSSTHWIGGCVGPAAGLDVLWKRQIPCIFWDLNSRLSSRKPSYYIDYTKLAPVWGEEKFKEGRKNKIQPNSVIASLRGLNKLCCYKQMSLLVRCMLKRKENIFRTKCSPAFLLQLLNVKDMNYSKFKLQLKLRNKNYTSINVN